jgi:hypothetical protein
MFLSSHSNSQKLINIIDSGRKTSLRGLSVVDDYIVWASGSNGTIARSTNGGKTFEWLKVNGYEQRDFRDVEAFDASTALIMAVAEPAVILKTKDGGKTWKKVFEDTTKGMFLDAMDFAEGKFGTVIGDPIFNNLFFAFTYDNGENWLVDSSTVKATNINHGEALFAASGTNIRSFKRKDTIHLYYVTGGTKSRFSGFGLESSCTLPIVQGKETTGANSLATWTEKKFVVVGGDFSNDKDTTGNCALSFNAGIKWINPQTPPHGYRSCVEYITKDQLITCGTSGVDISNDGGMNWESISTQSFHVCQKAKKGSKVFLAGANGKIATLSRF